MGLLAATLSLVLLVQHALNVGLTPVFHLLLDYYDWFRSALLSPLKPIAQKCTAQISQLLKVKLELSDHWGDVFVLMIFYLGARAKAYWDTGAYQHAV